VENVSRPTMTVYSPSGKEYGAAVVVFPGGGYQDLAIDLEARGLRLADAQRDYVCAVEIPCAGFGAGLAR